MNLTLEEIKLVAHDYIDANEIGKAGYEVKVDTLTGLLGKIGKQFTINSEFKDTMPELEGDPLILGKQIEEWFEDLTMPSDFDPDGKSVLAPADPSYRPTVYSYPLGRVKFKKTVRGDKYNPYALTQEDLKELIDSILTKLYNSKDVYKSALKMQLVSQNIINVDNLYYSVTIRADYRAGGSIPVGEYATSEGEDNYYVALNKTTPIVAGNIDTEEHWRSYLQSEITKGNLVQSHLLTTMPRPTDESTTKAWLLELDKVMEKTLRNSEGYSLSGNTLGIQNKSNLMLYVADGILPLVNQYKSTLPATSLIDFKTQVKPLGEYVDLGTMGTINAPFAILMDTRGSKLHNNYQAIREDNNGEGDFKNYILHDGETAHISPNTFINVFAEDLV